MTLMAVDLGTSGVKVTLTDHESGEVLASAKAAYPLHSKKQGWAEQNPADWWKATRQAIRECLGKWRGEPRAIRAIGFSGQMCGVVPVDSRGEPLYDCITYLDTRCVEEIDLLRERESELRRIGLNPVSNLLTAPKLLWLMRQMPEVWRHTHKWLLPKDFVRLKLTGAYGTDFTDASATMFMDFYTKTWDPIVERFGLEIGRFPDIHRPDEVVGYVTAQAAGETGLAAGIPVVAGAADMACTALGTRSIAEGELSLTIGTAGHVIAPIRKPDPAYANRFYQFCHAVPDLYYAFGAVFSGGLSLAWMKNALLALAPAGEHAESEHYARLNELASRAAAGSSGLFFLPFLTGSGVPYSDPQAKGAFIGLTVRHSAAEMVRAVMEGVSYNFKQIVTSLESAGIPVRRLFAGEGGSNSELWTRILTATLAKGPLSIMRNKDSAPLGAAILAGMGVGLYHDWKSAVERMTAVDEIEQDPVLTERYREAFAVYEQLYPSLRAVFQQIHRMEADS